MKVKKLQNKKTGEICEFMIHKRVENSKDGNPVYEPFTDSVEDWKDYEDPKYEDGWLISCGTDYIQPVYAGFSDETLKKVDELGLLFETEEDAKNAVEKLKALKRLRDKGFKFAGFSEGSIDFKLDEEYAEFTYNGYDEGCEFYINNDVDEDLDTLFRIEK